MGFDDFVDLKLDLTDSDLAKLDRLAAKAEKKLEKAQKDLKRKGGIFGGEAGGSTLPRGFEKKLEKEAQSFLSARPDITGEKISTGGAAPIQRGRTFDDAVEEAVKRKGLFKEALETDLGASKATRAFNILQNPQAWLISQAPIIGSLIIAVDLIDKIIKELQKKGGFFDRFFTDTINTRLDAFRDKLLTAQLRAALDQQLIITNTGSTSPRDAYNTFELAENNRKRLEEDFSVRINDRGY